MFDVIHNNWIKITFLNTIYEPNFRVYDIKTNPFNNFVANGILLDMKT